MTQDSSADGCSVCVLCKREGEIESEEPGSASRCTMIALNDIPRIRKHHNSTLVLILLKSSSLFLWPHSRRLLLVSCLCCNYRQNYRLSVSNSFFIWTRRILTAYSMSRTEVRASYYHCVTILSCFERYFREEGQGDEYFLGTSNFCGLMIK